MSPALTSSTLNSLSSEDTDDSGQPQHHVKSSMEMDEERRENVAYQYMCHLEEAKNWMEAILKETLVSETNDLEASLRNGVTLAKLSCYFAPKVVQKKKIFDLDQRRYLEQGLHFRHTDNINYFLQATKCVGLPQIFVPETTDIYDAKNMPRVIFCIHALSLFLYKLGLAPPMQDLYGKVTFSEEQISAMKSALDNYGLPMPQFRKIGGILADEVTVDAAALHAAIIAINNALDQQDSSLTLAAMQNPNACLTDVDPDAAKKYHLVLGNEKREKIAAANNQPLIGDGYAAAHEDAYDELLTQNEIQAHVDKLNLLTALEKVEDCVRSNELSVLKYALTGRHLKLKAQVKNGLLSQYMLELARVLDTVEFLRSEDVQSAVSKVNHMAASSNGRDVAVARVNSALAANDADMLVRALQDSSLGISSHILPYAAPLYLVELNYIREGTRADMRYEGIVKVCEFLSVIAKINRAIEQRDVSSFWQLATCPNANLEDLEYTRREKYCENLGAVLNAKLTSRRRADVVCPLLNHAEIQDALDLTNGEFNGEMSYQKIEAIKRVNEAVRRFNADELRVALVDPNLGLARDVFGRETMDEISQDEAVHYLCLLRDIQANRSLAEKQDSELWMENILEAIKAGHEHNKEAQRAGTALAVVNMAVLQGDPKHTFQTLCHDDLNLSEELHDGLQYQQTYQDELCKTLRSRGDEMCSWVLHYLKDGDKVYLDLQSHSYSWRIPRDFNKRSCYLGSADIDAVLNKVHAKMDSRHKFDSSVVRLQARMRGFLVRRKLFTMLQHYYENEAKLVKVQSLWRGRMQRRKVRKILEEKKKTRLRSLAFYRMYESQIITIQRAWRGVKTRREFKHLLERQNAHKTMDVPTVRKYLHLLDMRPEDFQQELELQALKGDITKMVRLNQNLEKDLDAMDIKIGLLVKNRIDVEDVVAHGKTMSRRFGPIYHKRETALNHPQQEDASGTLQRGLKALKKESRHKLDAYQHLFYQLQTDPNYLAKLIFVMPQSSSTKFLDSVILTLYNFGANQREEYLLLKLFKTALQEEIHCKVEQLNDIVCGSPLVIKMIVGFYRSGRGQMALRETLGPLIKRILEDKSLHINTNPVDIYKQWINAKELESGQACGMPYDVTQAEALKYEEVKTRLAKSITKLKQCTTMFLATIVKSRAKLPFGILYMAKVLHTTLREKFPKAPEKDILKVVGNLVYYRYINSAIVAPDAFSIVDVTAESGGLTNDQRRNLGSIAKILQFAATKKGFGDESPHLMGLNSYIVECHDKFKKFFQECCTVPEPEDAFSMDQYTEATLIAKPVIYISLQELHDTHLLLLKHLDQIAPEKSDPLRELLEDLGDSPSICSLLGAAAQPSAHEDSSLAHLAKTEVCLTLTNKFNFTLGGDKLDTDKLFIKTKQLIISVLPCTSGENLIGCLKSRTLPQQEQMYWDLIAEKQEADHRAEVNRTMIEHTNLFQDDEGNLPLDECKRQILKNLQILERHGYVSSKDGCSTIIASLAKDICNQRSYRSRRRREIFRLKRTIRDMDKKTHFHKSQVEYYDQYLKTCLANLQTAKKRVHFKKTPNSRGGTQSSSVRSNNRPLRYSASKLHDKGILLSIDGLPSNQFKNVLFEIVPTNTDGLFEIHAKFMGVRLEHVEVDIQELLQLQYEGVSVMNMFGKAKINVNLLLHFLNAKFYGKRK